MSFRYQFIDSRFGDLALVWRQEETGPRVVHILIPSPKRSLAEGLDRFPGADSGSQPQIDALCERIARYLRGEVILLPTDLLDASLCTPFQWRVLVADYAIPRGEVRTYQQMAAAAGNMLGARAAGNALATNPFPIVIPCHRAIRSDGSLGGYYGGLPMKRALLEIEGVHFDQHGRVVKGQGST